VVSFGIFIGIMYASYKYLGSSMSQLNKGGDVFGMGKSNAKLFNVDSGIKIRFKDVAGLDEAK
jgi:AFG3 family protein